MKRFDVHLLLFIDKYNSQRKSAKKLIAGPGERKNYIFNLNIFEGTFLLLRLFVRYGNAYESAYWFPQRERLPYSYWRPPTLFGPDLHQAGSLQRPTKGSNQTKKTVFLTFSERGGGLTQSKKGFSRKLGKISKKSRFFWIFFRKLGFFWTFFRNGGGGSGSIQNFP